MENSANCVDEWKLFKKAHFCFFLLKLITLALLLTNSCLTHWLLSNS